MKNGELKKVDPTIAIATLIGMVIHSFIMKPLAEYVSGKPMNLSTKRFGAFVTGIFFDGLADSKPRQSQNRRAVRT